ncbi:MAG TPA: ubiquitin-conjugating enzyme E2 [Flavobacteriales bacterium]|nr:ubiquitin-conjugating enzyme E2 [Flavobacteriales bacterium]
MKKNTPSQRRKMMDISALQNSGHLIEMENDGTMICKLCGPADTPYENMNFKIRITLPLQYPFHSPSVGFIGNIYHPNVDFLSGTICLNVLNQEWTPVYNLVAIIETLLPQLLTYPNPDDPLNEDAAKLLLENPEEYKQKCKLQSDSI